MIPTDLMHSGTHRKQEEKKISEGQRHFVRIKYVLNFFYFKKILHLKEEQKKKFPEYFLRLPKPNRDETVIVL